MKITLTIEVEDNKVTVTPITQEDSNKEIEQDDKNVIKVPEVVTEKKKCDFDTIGETLPKGRYATSYLPRTEEYPYNVKDAKSLLDEYNINIGELARAMGNFPSVKLRNIFRYDYRRFTKEEFDVILKAINSINKEKEIKL